MMCPVSSREYLYVLMPIAFKVHNFLTFCAYDYLSNTPVHCSGNRKLKLKEVYSYVSRHSRGRII